VLGIGLMTLQVGRKPSKSKNLGLMQNVELPFCHISYQAIFARGAKREIRDNDGKMLFNGRNTRMQTPYFCYMFEGKPMPIPLFCQKKDVEITLKNLIQKGCKKPKAEPMVQWLPRKCPSCDNEGTIVWGDDYRDYKKEQPKIRFWYNHSKTKPKRCFLGTWDDKLNQIRLKKGIDFRKMFFSYYLKPGEVREFNIV